MMNSRILKACCFASLFTPFPMRVQSQLTSKNIQNDKPNFVFIFADDLTIDALGFTNNELITPNLDRLRNEGAFISRAFNQGAWNGAVSIASRTMLVTGKYLWKAAKYLPPKKAKPFKTWPEEIDPNNYEPKTPEKHWSEYMKEAGYTTYFTGKWHVSTKNASDIFDKTIHIRPGMPEQCQACYDRKFIPSQDDIWQADDTVNGGYWKGGKHWSEVLADDAIDFIHQAASDSKPFFMEFAFNAPHDPRQSPREFLDLYPVDQIKMPVSFMPLNPYADAIGCGKNLRDELLAPFPRTPYSVQKNRQEYYALISHLDAQIGKIMDALQKSGKMNNTYIFFTADHGLAVGDHGFMGKQNMYDLSMSSPMIVVGPEVKKGATYDDLIYIQDVAPTIMELAGCKNPITDFQSFLPLLLGKKYSKRDALYGAYLGLQRMVRTEQYKMIVYPMIDQVLLYDLKKDPHEMTNLSYEKKYRKVMDQLLKKMLVLQKQTEDPLNITPYYQKFMTNL